MKIDKNKFGVRVVNNYSSVGFTMQKCICDTFKIVPNSEKAINCFKTNYKEEIAVSLKPLIGTIFQKIGLKPIKCTTMDAVDGKNTPYNFVLEDNSTLSIRTNLKGDKVAPREIGQAGFAKLNEHFGQIYGSKIENKSDIKKLIYYHVDETMPVFIDYFFDADYIVWVYFEDDKFKFEIISGNSVMDLNFERTKFAFSRPFDDWNESITLKYEKKSIAEVQVHKNRTFKFRFIMRNVLPFIKNVANTTETFGITAEKTICDIYSLAYPPNLLKRSSMALEREMTPIIMEAFKTLPRPIMYCGNRKGERGGQSKSPYDFILSGNKTLSLKTNTGKMVCPPEVGQPNAATCYLYFGDFVNDDCIDKDNFKDMVYEHIESLVPVYLEHLFDSDFLLRIFKDDNSKYKCQIISKNYGNSMKWNKSDFSFSKKTKTEWNESNTLYYKTVSIGEFQVHKNRNCFKFRFNFENTIALIREYLETNDSKK